MFFSLLLAAHLSAAPTPRVRIIEPAHQKIIGAWLTENPGFRIALESDCGCKDDIQRLRRGMGGAWKAVPDYSPYYVVGDFNNDGANDFAIVAIKSKLKGKAFKILLFNGPFAGSTEYKPAFISEFLNLHGQGLFFGPPRPKPYRLLVGAFESEGILLVPKGQGYCWDRADNE